MDTMNRFLVGVQGDQVRVMNPRDLYTREEAITLAAWLAVMANTIGEPDEDRVIRLGELGHAVDEVVKLVRAIEAA